MKFILLIEENGYELRYWDEITGEIGASIISSWDKKEFHKKLVNMDFHIDKDVLLHAMDLIENKGKNFVMLCSKNKPHHLDILHDDTFEVED